MACCDILGTKEWSTIFWDLCCHMALSVLGGSTSHRVMGFGKRLHFSRSGQLRAGGLPGLSTSPDALGGSFPKEKTYQSQPRSLLLARKCSRPNDPLGFGFFFFNYSRGIAGNLVQGSSPCPCSPLFLRCLFFPLMLESMCSSKAGDTPPSLGLAPGLPQHGSWSLSCGRRCLGRS